MIHKRWDKFFLAIVVLTLTNFLLMLWLMPGLYNRGRKMTDTINTKEQELPKVEAVLNEKNGTTNGTETSSAGGRTSGSSLVLGRAFKVDESMGRWNERRQYKIHDHVFTGIQYPRLTKESPVCLATQTSVEKLFWLTQVAKYWTLPISVAVFIPDVDYAIARAYLTYLVICFPFLGEKVSFHFTYPGDHLPRDIPLVINYPKDKCDQPLVVLQELLKHRDSEMWKWRERLPYPQNVGRNIGRKNCGTDWVFVTDIDIIPISGLSGRLATFLTTRSASQCKRCAFVIPTYEVDERSPFPHNRSSLLRLVEKGRARPFHQKVFVNGQHATNFSRWQAREKAFPREDTVSISHPVTNLEFFYEPFYVARDDAPPHDERFVGFGFNRNTQVYEMIVSGYSFHVLSPIFTVHWGLQVKSSRPLWRDQQNAGNYEVFKRFKREIFAKYGKAQHDG